MKKKKEKSTNNSRKLLQQRYPGILKWYNNIHKYNPHKCENCGKTRGKINAHHILGKAAYPEYATHQRNWILLCRTCHKLIHRTTKMQQPTITKKKQIQLLCQKKIKDTVLYKIYKSQLEVKNVKKIKQPSQSTKSKIKKFQYNGISFDSNEEIFFYKWCQQAVQYKILNSFNYHPNSYILSQNQFKNGKKILNAHKYTPDFSLSVSDFGRMILSKTFKNSLDDEQVVIEIKPAYSPFGSIEEFSINRKWMYEKFNVFIQKVQVDSLFTKTWCPQSCKLTEKTKKIRSKYAYCDTITKFIQRGNNEKLQVQKVKKIRKAV